MPINFHCTTWSVTSLTSSTVVVSAATFFSVALTRSTNSSVFSYILARLAAATGGEYGYVDVNQRRE